MTAMAPQVRGIGTPPNAIMPTFRPMNSDDLIKAAPELVKGVGALAAAVRFTAVVKRMLGPAAGEVAEM